MQDNKYKAYKEKLLITYIINPHKKEENPIWQYTRRSTLRSNTNLYIADTWAFTSTHMYRKTLSIGNVHIILNICR
jgi:hypothetical protein